jgi:polysaccharide biosynthesis protein PslH
LLKVLQICNKAPYPANDGSSIAIYNMTRGLLDCGVQVKLLTINTKKHFKEDNRVPDDFRKVTGYTSVYKDTSPTFAGGLLNLFSTASYFVSRFRFRAYTAKLTEILQRETFDIIQIEGLFMCAYIPVLRKLSNARIVLRAHNVEHLIWERHIVHETRRLMRWYYRLQNRRLRAFEHKALEQVDALVPITASDGPVFTRMGFTKPMQPCITGVAAADFREGSESEEKPFTVFYIGSMDWLPNREAVTWFIHNCWEKVREKVPQASLVIGGRGMPLQLFHLNKPHIQIVEHVEDASEFFHAHEVMIVPLLSGSGLRIKIIEGMAYGRAIVSTTIGAEGINYRNGENIIIADSADSFAAAVAELLLDREKRLKIAASARSFALREFDNAKVVGSLVQFYKTLVDA